MSEKKQDLKPWRSYEAIYNEPDPRAYFRTLEPLGYRQPDVLAGFLALRGEEIASQLGRPHLRVLDFGCGYGALGAVLRHRLLMQDLYAHFHNDAPGDNLSLDRSFFAAHRSASPDLELGGIDIAERAVAYALACGLIDEGFTENLATEDPGPALAAFFAETDLVVETGAVYDHVPACYQRLLNSSERRPWFLFGPRGDADIGPVHAILEAQGYRLESVSAQPRRYRRYADAEEQAECEARMAALGRQVSDHSRAGWMVNPLILARPASQAKALPLQALHY